jgi:RecJ-like exonuclease
MQCLVCDGIGFIRTLRDVSAIYKRPQKNLYTMPCPYCAATGKVEPPPFDSKAKAAGETA